ncbi:hypothetical protein [Novipirellula galeiformis]|uniref:hypothetical protein n=1 Tax=Novipirellula galeiformis TaxID=2528004 RepID=UPI0011B35CDA|nr:hypothetical protein [Novipirellula galeiformis]
MATSPKNEPDKPGSKLIGCAVLASIAVGVIATIGGVAAMANANDYTGGGILMFAAACSFGLLANALLRR